MSIDPTILKTIISVVVIAFADWILGLLAAWRSGIFLWSEVARHLRTSILPVVGSLLLLGILQTQVSGAGAIAMAGLFAAGTAGYLATARAAITSKIGIILQPDSVRRAPDPVVPTALTP